ARTAAGHARRAPRAAAPRPGRHRRWRSARPCAYSRPLAWANFLSFGRRRSFTPRLLSPGLTTNDGAFMEHRGLRGRASTAFGFRVVLITLVTSRDPIGVRNRSLSAARMTRRIADRHRSC